MNPGTVEGPTELYISGESTPIFLQSNRTELYHSLEERLGMKKCRQKHGGFRPLLTPYGTYGYRYLPLTNRDAMLLTKSFAPLVFSKKNYGFLVFGTKSSRKIFSFSLVDIGTCKNNEIMFLLTGKS